MHEKQRKTVNNRIAKEKEKVLEALKKTPVVHAACERSGVSKATFYRWRADDKEFAEKADAALSDGKELISDIAISQLISAIRDKNMGAIKFWLGSHHPDYKTKVEIDGSIDIIDKLSPEQEQLVRKALAFAKIKIESHE